MKKGFYFFSLIALLILPLELYAAANVTVTPQRVVLEGKLRSQTLTLLNTGDTPGEFRIEVSAVYINDAGQYQKISEPNQDQLKVVKFFRIAPRKLTLRPGESQIVRVASRKPSTLEKGEYMAALTVKPINLASNNKSKTNRPPSQSTVSIDMQVSVTLPLILRQGELDSKVTISDVNFSNNQNGQNTLNVTLTREGGRSVNAYMEAHVERNGRKQKIGQTWFVMYPPQTNGSGRIPIKLPAQFDTKGSNLIVSVVERQVGPHNGEVLGKAIFALE